MVDYASIYITIFAVVCLMGYGAAQEEFTGPVVCYHCLDEAVNTTCGMPLLPVEEGALPTIECKRGACVKWTFYKNNILMLERTCSEEMDLLIPLNQVCRTERNGNGYLCMCADDYCNGATTIFSGGHFTSLWLCLLSLALILVLNTRVL